jgi:hypothetical protein
MFKRGVIVIILLIFLLVLIDSAWIFSYKKTITTEITGQSTIYTISHEFDNALELDTSDGPSQINTSIKIKGLGKDVNMSFDISTRRTNVTVCPNYDDDCDVIVTQIYNNDIRKILSDKPTTIGDKENFTLFKNVDNMIEYQIVCVQNSCPQRIISNVTLTEIR